MSETENASPGVDLIEALRRGNDLAVLEDGRTVAMTPVGDRGLARLWYGSPPGPGEDSVHHREWVHLPDGRWISEDACDLSRQRHPRVVATLRSGEARGHAGLPDDGRVTLELRGVAAPGDGDEDEEGDDEPDALRLGDHVLLSDLDGPVHLARVARAMLTGYPDARRNGETRYALAGTDSVTSDWRTHQSHPLALVIDPRPVERGSIWCVPLSSDALHRQRHPDDVLRAAGYVGVAFDGTDEYLGVEDAPPGYRVLRRTPLPDEVVRPRWLQRTPRGYAPGYLALRQPVAGVWHERERPVRVYVGSWASGSIPYAWDEDRRRFVLSAGFDVDLLEPVDDEEDR